MKRTTARILAICCIIITRVSPFSAYASSKTDITSPTNGNRIVSTEELRAEIKLLFPGLKEIPFEDSIGKNAIGGDTENKTPIIKVNSIEDLSSMIDGLNSAPLYKKQPVSKKLRLGVCPKSDTITGGVCYAGSL